MMNYLADLMLGLILLCLLLLVQMVSGDDGGQTQCPDYNSFIRYQNTVVSSKLRIVEILFSIHYSTVGFVDLLSNSISVII